MAADFIKLKEDMIRAMNDQNFTFVGEGLVEVENFIRDYLLSGGWIMSGFIMEEDKGVRRHLRIYCKNPLTEGATYMDLTVFDSMY
jgi:hypothetical protein